MAAPVIKHVDLHAKLLKIRSLLCPIIFMNTLHLHNCFINSRFVAILLLNTYSSIHQSTHIYKTQQKTFLCLQLHLTFLPLKHSEGVRVPRSSLDTMMDIVSKFIRLIPVDVGIRMAKKILMLIPLDLGIDIGKKVIKFIPIDVGMKVTKVFIQLIPLDVGVELSKKVCEEIPLETALAILERLLKVIPLDVAMDVVEAVLQHLPVDVGMELANYLLRY